MECVSFWELSYQLKAVKKELHCLHLLAEDRALVDHEKSQRSVLKGDVYRISKKLECYGHKNLDRIGH